MLSLSFLIGVTGGAILVVGAAAKEGKDPLKPLLAWKNRLFLVGNIMMFIYAILNWLEGGAIFFVFLESLMMTGTVLMIIKISDEWKGMVLGLGGACFVLWSLLLAQELETLVFILGLIGAALGVAFKSGTIRRGVALTLGAALIGAFGYFEANWIFFWLNLFFALFSGYHLIMTIRQRNI